MLSLVSQVTLYSVRGKRQVSTRLTKHSIGKKWQKMQAIIQAAIEAARAVTEVITDMADLAEGSTGRNAAGNTIPKADGPI